MGDIRETKDFSVNEDGTIVRARICSHCGKESTSIGEYCEHCGRKLPKSNLKKGIDYEKDREDWIYLLMIFGALCFGIPGIWCAFHLNSIVENDGMLYYRYNKETRRLGVGTLVISVLSTIIWSGAVF